jgi:superfamily II DNA or RNA helicase
VTEILSRRAIAKRWQFAGMLNDLQKRATGACMDSFDRHRGGILSLYCGAGKTVCALYLAAAMRRKTLVVVAKSFLCDQV